MRLFKLIGYKLYLSDNFSDYLRHGHRPTIARTKLIDNMWTIEYHRKGPNPDMQPVHIGLP